MDFKNLNLDSKIIEQLHKKGYKSPSPIQEKAIIPLMEGLDLLGIAQTGTGKTAAFSLPLINKFHTFKVNLSTKQIRALIITPTRELANQIEQNIKLYSSNLDISSEVLIGGVLKEPQIESLKNGVDIVIATPGRLIDLIKDSHICFKKLEAFVLDEADMMLDMGFLKDIQLISEKLPFDRQNILFSATMPKDIESLANNILIDPVKVEVSPQSSTLENINQEVYFVDEIHKLFSLSNILEDKSLQKVIIFCKAKYAVAQVVDHLENISISVGEIHSNKTQRDREKALSEFSEGKVRVLVATDIASRGIDVSKVSHVINYNLPEDATNYVHRIGRSGRAGESGMAISLCCEKDLPLLKNIEKLIKKTIPRNIKHAFHKEFVIVKKKSKSKRRRRNRK